MTTEIPPVDDLQRAFLRAIYERYHADSAWPTMKDLHRELTVDGHLDVYQAGQQIDPHYMLPHVDGRGGVALRLLGIREGKGRCEETDDYITIVRLAAQRYTTKGVEPKITAAELAELGISGGRLDRFNLLLEHTDFLSGPQGTADALYYEVWEGVDAYLKAQTIDDVITAFLKRQEGRDPRFGMPLQPAVRRSARVPGLLGIEDFEPPELEEASVDRRRVFVVHGRNAAAQKAVVELLRAFDLTPVLFRDVLPDTGKATPYVGDVLEKGFDSTYASVIVMTPDDDAWLRESLVRPRDPDYEKRPTGQARPNVLFEAGMGWSSHRGRSVILHLGALRPLTDLEGMHVLRFDDTPTSRRELGKRLEAVGCPVNFGGDFVSAGDFAAAIAATEQAPRPQPAVEPRLPWDDAWLVEQRNAAHAWRQSNGGVQSYMEAAFGVDPKLQVTRAQLRAAAEHAQVMTFGSSLAAVVPSGDGAPKPTSDGIRAQYAGMQSATYWSLTASGVGYLMHTNFEEMIYDNGVGVDTRMHRVTELLLHVRNLYAALGADPASSLFIEVRHGGLTGRALRFSNNGRIDPQLLMQPVRATTDTSAQTLVLRLSDLQGDLVPLVKRVLAPLFELFDFYEPAEAVYQEIVSAFAAGKAV